MSDLKKLVEVVQRNSWIIRAQTEGLTDADGLLQPPFRGNCMNWVLGHIADNRDGVLLRLEQAATLDEDAAPRYKRGSEPLEGAAVLSMTRLLEVLAEQEKRLAAALPAAQPELLAEIVDPDRGHTVADRIEFLIWHETYHVGQLEYLRQLAGTDDVVIA